MVFKKSKKKQKPSKRQISNVIVRFIPSVYNEQDQIFVLVHPRYYGRLDQLEAATAIGKAIKEKPEDRQDIPLVLPIVECGSD